MVVTYDTWPDPVEPTSPTNVVEATVGLCTANPGTIIQVKTYKLLSAARTGATLLDRARTEHPDRFPGTWRWVVAELPEPVETDGATHVAEIRAQYIPEVDQ